MRNIEIDRASSSYHLTPPWVVVVVVVRSFVRSFVGGGELGTCVIPMLYQTVTPACRPAGFAFPVCFGVYTTLSNVTKNVKRRLPTKVWYFYPLLSGVMTISFLFHGEEPPGSYPVTTRVLFSDGSEKNDETEGHRGKRGDGGRRSFYSVARYVTRQHINFSLRWSRSGCFIYLYFLWIIIIRRNCRWVEMGFQKS